MLMITQPNTMDVTEQVSILLDTYGVEAIMTALESLEAITYQPVIPTNADYVYMEATSNYYN